MELPSKMLAAIGISGMMHGYLPFDKEDNLLVPFRTWRNTITGEAAAELTEVLGFNIPQRWSIAHLYQAILNKEEHVSKISYSQHWQAIFTGSSQVKRSWVSVRHQACFLSIRRPGIMMRQCLINLQH